MLEAAVPTVLFTIMWLSTKDLRLALVVSVTSACLALAVRLVQRSTVQFAVNALVGIGIGWLFVQLAARNGGDANGRARRRRGRPGGGWPPRPAASRRPAGRSGCGHGRPGAHRRPPRAVAIWCRTTDSTDSTVTGSARSGG